MAAVGCGLLVAVAIECMAPLQKQPFDTSASDLAVYHELAHRGPGVVLELPMGDLVTVPSVIQQAPRMVYSTLDWHPRVNGYSGFVPPEYQAQSELLNAFPTGAALTVAKDLGVRYVVLDVGMRNGIMDYSASDARSLIAQLPSGTSAQLVGSAWLIELRNGP
jgi:hypothetical protein